jgi:hypothetical protein
MAVLDDFMRLVPGAEQWDDPAFASVLADFRRRFKATNTEEGAVMDTVLAYVMDQAYTSSRRALLAEYRNSERVRSLIEGGVLELDAVRHAAADAKSAFVPPPGPLPIGDASNGRRGTVGLRQMLPARP